MKFGRRIKSNLYPEWQEYYLNYSELKDYLKSNANGWDASKEAEFKEQLAKQLEKIYNFQKSKVGSIV